jgi:hypothetical protein
VEQQPEVVMRGFGGADITDQARELVLKTLDGLTTEQKSDYGMVKEKVRAELKRLIQKTTGRRPMIMPVILELWAARRCIGLSRASVRLIIIGAVIKNEASRDLIARGFVERPAASSPHHQSSPTRLRPAPDLPA